MKNQENDKRTRKVTIRLTQKEFDEVNTRFKNTTHQKLSEYIRAMLLSDKITVYTRDKSLDELIPVLTSLRKELNAVGNNFNQAVHKLHTLDRIPEFRSWIFTYENTKDSVARNVEEIKNKINQFSDAWLHG